MQNNVYVATPGRIEGSVDVIGSKSITQRALLASALAEGLSEIKNPSLCDDVLAVIDAIKLLGAEVVYSNNTLYINGVIDYNIKSYNNININCRESGFTLRSLLPILAANGSNFNIDGQESLINRAIGKEINVLEHCIEYNNTEKYYSITKKLQPGNFIIENPDSSQLISGFIMALPLLENDSVISIKNAVSIPYINLTINILKHYGIKIISNNNTEYIISSKQKYLNNNLTVEGDISGAAFFAVAGAISGKITLSNINMNSNQGDKAIFGILESCGAKVIYTNNSISIDSGYLQSFQYDASDTPDLFPPLVALACNCEGISEIQGANRLKEKESNRRDALISEFSKIGAKLWYKNDTMYIAHSEIKGTTVESHNDHRIAMALSIAALNSSADILIENANCVNKSYPNYYDILETIKR